MKKSFPAFLALAFLFCVFPERAEALNLSVQQSCISQGWPQDYSDLKPDPELNFGKLKNGFRYVILKNSEPKNRVGLYLNVQAGSLNEKDEQRGLAHFLEHMLFNGTENYPPGTLVEYFQSIGMSFGADTNAMTNYNQTVYNILLPDGSPERLDDGLQVIADYARGALLLGDEVDRERGIILAEKRTRDSAGYRLYKQKTKFFFAGTRVPERMPIGTEETLKTANPDLLRDFYDDWYQPQNMMLIVVGDMNPETVNDLIDKHFSKFKNPVHDPECYTFGKVEEKGTDYLYVYEPEVGYTEISINTRWNEKPQADSRAFQANELKRYVVDSLMNNRFKVLVDEPDSSITEGNAYSGDFMQRVGYASVSARAKSGMWQETMQLLDRTLRQALTQGFTEQEFQRVRKDIVAELERQVKTEGSRDSRKLARDIIYKINNNEVFLSPEQELQLYAPVLNSLTIDEINGFFKELWRYDNRQVYVGGAVELSGKDLKEDIIRHAYLESLKKEVSEWRNGDKVAFPYLSVPEEPAQVVADKELPDINAQQLRFANGTILNLKQTDFQPNEVVLSVHFGQGRLVEPVDGLAMLSEAVVKESAYGKMTKNQLEAALAGSNVQLSFNVGEESFQLNGKALTDEFGRLLQLVQAQLQDPAFREDAYRLSMERFNQMYDQLYSSVEGIMSLEGDRFLAGGNFHYGIPAREKLNQLTLQQVEQWLVPEFTGSLLEINVVGDISPEKVISMVGRYFGKQDRRTSLDKITEKVVFPAGKELKREVRTEIDKALVVVAWKTDDLWDIYRTRRLNVLSSVFDDRLRIEIREKLGAVYSPVVYNVASRVAEGYGVLRSLMTVDPHQAKVIADKVREVANRLETDGVTDDELQRALEPTLTSIKDMMRSNRYWLQTVLSLSSRHPEQLRWPLSIQEDYASVTSAEVSSLAAKYLQPDNSAEIVIIPDGLSKNDVSLTDKP